MSLKYTLLSFFALAVAVGGAYSKFRTTESKVGFPTFAGQTGSVYSNRGVVDRIIKIEMHYKQMNDDFQLLTAEITMPFDYNEALEYKWNLAENVTLADAALTGTTANLKANIPKKIQLRVRGLTKIENRFVGIEVSGQKNQRRIYGESLLSTQEHKSFEKIVQNVEKIKTSRNGKSSD